jgi:hypothetical protein
MARLTDYLLTTNDLPAPLLKARRFLGNRRRWLQTRRRMRNQPVFGRTQTRPYKIAFMHIPKTAGSSVIKAFEARFGTANCDIFSAEISDASFAGKAFVSGHVARELITANAFIFTFLRNPYRQIVSHLKWIDHYNMPEFASQAEEFPDAARDAFRRLARVDFSDAAGVGKYLAWVNENSGLQVAHAQSAMLGIPALPISKMCRQDLAQIVISRLQAFDFVGISEDVQTDLPRLFDRLQIRQKPKHTHVNRSPSRRSIDLSNPDMRAVLRKYIETDLYVYGLVSRLRSVAGAEIAAAGRPDINWRDALAGIGIDDDHGWSGIAA